MLLITPQDCFVNKRYPRQEKVTNVNHCVKVLEELLFLYTALSLTVLDQCMKLN